MTLSEAQRLVKSKQRVADHGEVFTPAWMVEDMLDLVKHESERIDSRVLEPACGSGNFLIPVLARKLATVELRHGKSEFEKRHYALLALMCVYGIELLEGEYTRKLVAVQPESTAELPAGAGLVVLDTSVTEELEAEGWAADVIRGLQDARKREGLEVSDRIAVVLAVPAEKEAWARTHAEHIASETLATSFDVVTEPVDGHDVVEGVTATVRKTAENAQAAATKAK